MQDSDNTAGVYSTNPTHSAEVSHRRPVSLVYKMGVCDHSICTMELGSRDTVGIVLDNLNCPQLTQLRSVCKEMQTSIDERYLEDGRLRASFLAVLTARSEGISTAVITSMLVSATTEAALEAVYEKLIQMFDDMYMIDTVVVSILTAVYDAQFDRYKMPRYIRKHGTGIIDCMASSFVRTCFLAMRYHVRNTNVQSLIQKAVHHILCLNTVTPCDFVYECLEQIIATNLTHHRIVTTTLEILTQISLPEQPDHTLSSPTLSTLVSLTIRTRIMNMVFVVIENFRYKGPQPATEYNATNMNAACFVLCNFIAFGDYDAQTMATAYGYLNRALTEKNPAAGRGDQWVLHRHYYLMNFASMVEAMASRHTTGNSPMIISFLNSGLLSNMNQDASHDDGLGEDIAIEASLYTNLLHYGYRRLLEMTEITQRVATFLRMGACTSANLPVENKLLTMLTRCITMVDVDPIKSVHVHWQKTFCKLGLISLCISKIWKYMVEYVAEIHKDYIWKTIADMRECNVLKWLDLLEVLLYKNQKTQRNFIRQRGMQVLFRVALSSYSSVEKQIMVLLCTMLRDNSKDVLLQCPDFLNREIRPDIDPLDIVTFASTVQKLSEELESI